MLLVNPEHSSLGYCLMLHVMLYSIYCMYNEAALALSGQSSGGHICINLDCFRSAALLPATKHSPRIGIEVDYSGSYITSEQSEPFTILGCCLGLVS